MSADFIFVFYPDWSVMGCHSLKINFLEEKMTLFDLAAADRGL